LSLFAIFYNFILIIIYILATPFLLYKTRTNKYKQAIPAKFFFKNNPRFEKCGVWFHACSMGEVKAIKSLVEHYKNRANISVITNTGFKEAKNIIQSVRYLPFEIFLPFWISKQKVLVVMEAELWYMLFLVAQKKGAKTFLINARISDKSYNSYKRFSFFYKKIFTHINKVFAQSEIDKIRLEELGAKNVEVIGNIKLAQLPQKKLDLPKPEGILITAGSTHENEESLVLNSYKKKFGKLIIVPRHPERFEKVDLLIQNFIKNKDISYHRYSQKEDFESDIILVDKMGILNDIYAISDVTILGGAFEKIGGHNPVEPAYFGNIIISGKYIFNQKSLFDCIKNYYLIEDNELTNYLENLQILKKPELIKAGSFDPIIKEIDKWL